MIPSFYFQKIHQNPISDTSTTNNQLDKQLKIAFMSVINSQAQLINKLIINQSYLKKLLYLKCHAQPHILPDMDFTDIKSFYDPAIYQKIQHLNIQQLNRSEMQEQQDGYQNKKRKKRQNFQSQEGINSSSHLSSSSSSSQSQQQQNENSSFKFKVNNNKFSQTKNIIKNFSKALFKFIQKFRVYVRKVLEKENITEEKFHSVLLKFKNKIFTMSKLRELWLPQGNQCHRAFRIISMEYLRKHSLNHIFYSRVVNYKIHNKYRRRFYEIIKSPSQFTNLKMD